MKLPDSYAAWLESIVHARDASAISDAPQYVCLPVWSFRPSIISVGRKGRADDGGVADLPVRLSWDLGSVVPVEDATLHGSIIGLGWDERFSCQIDGDGIVTGLPDGAHPASEPLSSRDRITSRGRTARWEMGMSLEQMIRRRMSEINLAVGAEVGGSVEGAVDPVLLDEIATDLHLGRDGEKGSVIHRAIEACLDPEAFRRVEVSRYLSVRLRARATERIRDALGDPRIGFKVRAVYREINPSSLDELIETYRERYPNDHLGRKVAINALSTGVTVDSATFSLDEEIVASSLYAQIDDEHIVA